MLFGIDPERYDILKVFAQEELETIKVACLSECELLFVLSTMANSITHEKQDLYKYRYEKRQEQKFKSNL